ncbi:MAG: ketoacyl-ACP synthase III [Lachnospiraceae bacterium]|nr:ketoacyl-ACP synthase III [Lachnospiraceae bacterium]
MLTVFDDIAIKGIVTAVPECEEECNQAQYAEIMGEKKLKRHVKLTGIERRRVIWGEQKTSDLAIEAVRQLLDETGWSADSIDILILVTQSQDMFLPATAMFVHKAFHFKKEMTVFDINLGCSGYTTGIQTIANLLQNTGDRAILLAGDLCKYNPEWKQNGEWEEHISDWLLFGSAISATAIEKSDAPKIYGMQYVNAEGCMDISKAFGQLPRMKGDAVFSFAINDVVDSIQKFMSDIHITDEDIDYYVFHQAQKMILDNMKDIMNIPDEKMLVSYKDYGNTSSASIPLTMCINQDKFVDGARVLMCGFGVGLAWSAVYMSIDSNMCLKMLETDRIYSY